MRTLLLVAALALGALVAPAAHADTDPYAAYPVEAPAGYDPQTTCTRKPRPGTVLLGTYLVSMYGGGGGAVNRACTGSSTSEHKDGRAVDWTLDAANRDDRRRAKAFLQAAFATDAAGNAQALARRMGIMYVIWNDRMYASWEGFAEKRYLSSGCRSAKKCSKTLRHRDHVHISLSRDGALGRTSFYLAQLGIAPPPL